MSIQINLQDFYVMQETYNEITTTKYQVVIYQSIYSVHWVTKLCLLELNIKIRKPSGMHCLLKSRAFQFQSQIDHFEKMKKCKLEIYITCFIHFHHVQLIIRKKT